MSQLKLKLYDTGSDSEGFDMVRGWMHVDLPALGQAGADDNIVIFGDPCSNEVDAMESAAETVLEYYHNNRKVTVADFSASVLEKKQYELQASKFFCQAFQEKMEQSIKQPANYSEMNANRFYAEAFEDKIEHLIKKYTDEKNRCTALHHDIAMLCHAFPDHLPIKPALLQEEANTPNDTALVFMGDKENPSCVDQLALALLDILRDGLIHEAKRGNSLYYILHHWVPSRPPSVQVVL